MHLYNLGTFTVQQVIFEAEIFAIEVKFKFSRIKLLKIAIFKELKTVIHVQITKHVI